MLNTVLISYGRWLQVEDSSHEQNRQMFVSTQREMILILGELRNSLSECSFPLIRPLVEFLTGNFQGRQMGFERLAAMKMLL